MKKERLDKLLVERGLVESREKAQRLIMCGVVYVNNQKADKVGTKFPIDVNIHIKEREKYVSRGGYKLERALKVFNYKPSKAVCLDIGASTGGFTDCLLQNGAEKVYAVDVGKNQLHEKLKNDNRVISLEKTNARYLSPKEIPEKVNCFVSDVSFISITKILPNICNLIEEGALGIVLIKPQFELSKKEVKDGVVKDKELHFKAVKNTIQKLEESCYCILDINYSTMWGSKGNIEFLALLKKTSDKSCKNKISDEYIKDIIEEAHQEYKKSGKK